MPSEYFIPRTQRQFYFDRAAAPVLRVSAGDEVVFDCADTCSGQVRSTHDLHDYQRRKHPSNPLTGPVYIEGAKAGGMLVIEVLGIELDPIGFHLIGPNRAVIRDEVAEWKHYEVRVEGDQVVVGGRLRLPVDPVIGSLGNAPAGAPTQEANRCGGNLDVPQVRRGAKLYLPIEVDGAIFSLGDVHARQGDGELVGAPEIGARVRVRFAGALAEAIAPWPVIEHADTWSLVTTAAKEQEADAIRLAAIAGGRLLARQRALPFDDAMILLGMVSQIRCSRTGRWGAQGPVICLSWPKSIWLHKPLFDKPLE